MVAMRNPLKNLCRILDPLAPPLENSFAQKEQERYVRRAEKRRRRLARRRRNKRGIR